MPVVLYVYVIGGSVLVVTVITVDMVRNNCMCVSWYDFTGIYGAYVAFCRSCRTGYVSRG